MRIIVDAFGGDNAPREVLKGCSQAVRELGVAVLLCGRGQAIRQCAEENGISMENMDILDAPDILQMTDAPSDILKKNNGSSMAAGLNALADGQGEAFVSAGPTGSLVMGSTFLVKRIKGVKRPAIAALMPSAAGPFMLIDAGANADCVPAHLAQFAVMGDIYMKHVMRFDSPRVALANIGAEETKGDKLRIEAYALMKGADYRFIGNAEARDIPLGCCEVAVADGFTGNILLKMYEGAAGAVIAGIKDIYKKNALTMLSALMVKRGMTQFKKKMDYTETGGAPLLGINGTVIKAHGSSDANAIKNAIRQAEKIFSREVIRRISENIHDKTI